MEKVAFKFGLLLGFLITINIANLINIFVNTTSNGNLFWVFNGVIAVILCFIHAVWIDEVLQDLL